MTKHIEIDAEQYRLQCDELDELRRLVKDLEADATRGRYLMSRLSVISPHMDGSHGWRFRGGWPSLVGPTRESAVDFAIEQEKKREAKS